MRSRLLLWLAYIMQAILFILIGMVIAMAVPEPGSTYAMLGLTGTLSFLFVLYLYRLQSIKRHKIASRNKGGS